MRFVPILLVACAGPPPSSPSVDVAAPVDAAVVAPDASEPSYSSNAADVYAQGEAAFDRQDFARAEAIFRDLARKFPYSRYAKKAEMKIADIYFAQQKWAEARAAYEKWIADHRSEASDVEHAKKRIEAIDHR